MDEGVEGFGIDSLDVKINHLMMFQLNKLFQINQPIKRRLVSWDLIGQYG